MNPNKDIPSWMQNDDYPFKEIRQYAQGLKNNVANPMTSSPVQEPKIPEKQDEPKRQKPKSGFVFLVWKDLTSDAVETEAGIFKTRSTFCISEAEPYSGDEELEVIVTKFQTIIAEYDKIPNRKGSYVIMLGNVLKAVKRRLEIEFEEQ